MYLGWPLMCRSCRECVKCCCSDCWIVGWFEESFEEPNVQDVAYAVVTAAEWFGARVQFLSYLLWRVKARDEAGLVDCEERKFDHGWFNELMVSGGCFIDRDFDCGASELSSFVPDLDRYPPWFVTEAGDLDLLGRSLAGDGEPVPGGVCCCGVELVEPLSGVTPERKIKVGCRTGTNPES